MEVAVDFIGLISSGKYLLVVIDKSSRFPEVEIITIMSTKATTPKLNAILSRQGVPEILKTDHGPPFNGKEFTSYAEYEGFNHKKITPI